MKSRNTYQVQVVVGEDEPQDNALKRFRREVMSAGELQLAMQALSCSSAAARPSSPLRRCTNQYQGCALCCCQQSAAACSLHFDHVLPCTHHPCFTSAGVIPEVRRRRYFENAVDAKKRKTKEARMAAKRQQAVRSFAQVAGQEPAPFSDMFGTGTEDLEIFI